MKKLYFIVVMVSLSFTSGCHSKIHDSKVNDEADNSTFQKNHNHGDVCNKLHPCNPPN